MTEIVPKAMAILFYEYVADVAEKRPMYREQHLGVAGEWHAAGRLRLAGAYAEPLDGAALVFSDRASAEQFPTVDPYVLNGLVTRWSVRDWNVVIGE
jgi:uncharacterized protein YciI